MADFDDVWLSMQPASRFEHFDIHSWMSRPWVLNPSTASFSQTFDEAIEAFLKKLLGESV